MGISVKELKQLDKNAYQIIDIRDETEISHGAIPGAVALPAEAIESSEQIDPSKKLVICCNRGKFSVEVAEHLKEQGLDAVSLDGGYIAWLMDIMSEPAEQNKAKDVELSLRKKFKMVGGRLTNTGTPWHKDDCFTLMPAAEKYDC